MEEVQYFTQPQTNEEQKRKWKQWQLNNIAKEISGSACVVYSNDRTTQSGVGKLCAQQCTKKSSNIQKYQGKIRGIS